MLHQAPASFETGPLAARERDLLRFITCGSVDDGKSTLIGRLLVDSKHLFDDQLAVLTRDSRKHGTQGEALDLALLVDGLSAEREQGITIDVAYRFFSTQKRGFIVADTPGHEQYTRNMATGASTADLAILLVDARKGLTRQTRRHSLLVSMLGIRRVVVAVNKMDLVAWSQDSFERIMEDFRAFAAGLNFAEIAGIPISARDGDNISASSPNARWYGGPALLPYLEEVDVEPVAGEGAFRMPVQWVNRPDLAFRGFAGLIAGGRIRPGDRVRILPSGEETRVARIVTYDGDLGEAVAGQAVTLTLADERDASRGSLITSIDRPGELTDRLSARLFWMARQPLREGNSLLLKLGTQNAVATIAGIRSRVDLATLTDAHATALEVNDVGDVEIALDRLVAHDEYAANRETGSFILIDRESFDTVAMGLVAARKDHAFEAVPTDEPVPAAPPTALAGEPPTHTLLRVASWRVFGSVVTGLLVYALARDVRLALAVAGADLLVKPALHFLHERFWLGRRSGARAARIRNP